MSLHGGRISADNYDVGPDHSDDDRSVRSARVVRSSGLLHNGPFVRLWLAQIISNLGDWAYVLAVEIAFLTSLEPSALVRATAIFFGVEGLTSAVIGLTFAHRSSSGAVIHGKCSCAGLMVSPYLLAPSHAVG